MWTSRTVSTLRILINDMDSDTYTDAQLQKVIATAALYVEQELQYSTDYTIDTSVPSISPDFTVGDDEDVVFENFVILKAACLLTMWDLKAAAALEGVRARAGSMIELDVRTGHTEGLRLLIEKGVCQTYSELKDQYLFGNAKNIRAVLSPFKSNSYNPDRTFGRSDRLY